jgi:hypothetical protein
VVLQATDSDEGLLAEDTCLCESEARERRPRRQTEHEREVHACWRANRRENDESEEKCRKRLNEIARAIDDALERAATQRRERTKRSADEERNDRNGGGEHERAQNAMRHDRKEIDTCLSATERVGDGRGGERALRCEVRRIRIAKRSERSAREERERGEELARDLH